MFLNCHWIRNHLWLVNPANGVVGTVYDIVCPSTIAASERGRHKCIATKETFRTWLTGLHRGWVGSLGAARILASIGGNRGGWESVGEYHLFLCVNTKGGILDA